MHLSTQAVHASVRRTVPGASRGSAGTGAGVATVAGAVGGRVRGGSGDAVRVAAVAVGLGGGLHQLLQRAVGKGKGYRGQ